MFAVAKGEERGFFADHIVFDYNFAARPAECALFQHFSGGGERFGLVVADERALTGRQAACFDDNRSTLCADIGTGCVGIGERAMPGGGHADAFHKLFGKGLAAFDLRRSFGGAKYLQSARLEAVDDAAGERVVRTDDRQVDALVFGKLYEAVYLAGELVAI